MNSAGYDYAVLEPSLAALSDPDRDQYFLTNPAKLQYILDSADIGEADRVVEVGAGVGTVARVLPTCASLTLIELDSRLIPTLRNNAPRYATVLNDDGIEILRQRRLEADVILGNLPNQATSALAELLPTLDFRISILAAGSTDPFEALTEQLEYSVLTAIWGNDFTPYQPGTSYLVSVRRRSKS